MQWACYKKASAYGSRLGWTLSRRIHTYIHTTVGMAKTGFKPLKGVEEGGGEGKESHTNIARPYVMPKKQYKSFLDWALLGPY